MQPLKADIDRDLESARDDGLDALEGDLQASDGHAGMWSFSGADRQFHGSRSSTRVIL